MSVLADVLIALVPCAPLGRERARDRRLVSSGRARCALRAVRGRVLDVGAEWSAGTCEISTGRIRFSPTIGIVDDRDIDVLEVLTGDVDPDEVVRLGLGQTVTYVLRTDGGDLWWALPAEIADAACDLLVDVAAEA